MADRQERITLKLGGKTFFYFLQRYRAASGNLTLQIGAPELFREQSKSPLHASVFATDDELVMLVADESGPEHTRERHIRKFVLPLSALQGLVERVAGMADSVVQELAQRLASHVVWATPQQVSQYEFVSNVPLTYEALQAAAKTRGKSSSIDYLNVFSRCRVIPGATLANAHLPAALIVSLPGGKAWLAPFMAMGHAEDGRFILLRKAAFVELAAMSSNIALRSVEGIPDLSFINQDDLTPGEEALSEYPFFWTDDVVRLMRNRCDGCSEGKE